MDYDNRCPHLASSSGVLQYNADSNLFFLREDLADEMGAIIGYMECAAQTHQPQLSETFTRIASEETGHFIRIIRMVSRLDPVQAELLKQQELTILTLMNDSVHPPENHQEDDYYPKDGNQHRRKNFSGEQRHFESEFWDLECLEKAIRDELKAINAYQKQVQITADQNIQNLLITIMNKEKEHLARFIKLFYELSHSFNRNKRSTN